MKFSFCPLLCFGLIGLVIIVEQTVTSYELSKSNLSVKPTQESLPPCKACRLLTDAFKKGMEKTARGKFDGGDASWEESRLGAYATSEVRFVEITEKLCLEEKTSDQCHRLAEEHEHLLEEWWFKSRASFPDIFYFLCIDKLQVCCPENHYGPDCMPCFGGLVNPCSGHGQCKGGGTRKGSGLCRCDIGYAGEFCSLCKVGYYNDSSNEPWHCTKCDEACKAHCREGGPKGCEVCADGYEYSTEFGCVDVNECIFTLQSQTCKHGTFCVNTIGSYQCVDCDKSCDGCSGDGPDMCERCGKGYVYEDPVCIESNTWQRSFHVEIARYATYLGLCVATCIIFKRSIFIAGVIGVLVAIYIGLSEYTVGEWDKRSFIRSIKSLTVL